MTLLPGVAVPPDQGITFTVLEAEAGKRLDRVLATHLPGGATRSLLRSLFATGRVRVNGRVAAKGRLAAAGDRVAAELPEGATGPSRALPEPDAPLLVRLETPHLVVVEKPAGQPTAPLRAGEGGTLANALLGRHPEMAGVGYSALEPGLVHRLDTGTSGLVLAARSPEAFRVLRQDLRDGRIRKTYLLLCRSGGLPDQGEVLLPLAPHPRDARRVLACLHPRDVERHGARPAHTEYRVIERRGGLALVEATPFPAARRHQIRAHLAAIGHPLLGDALYGGPPSPALGPGRHALHAHRIAWPGDEETDIPGFDAASPLPDDLAAALETGK